MTARVLILGGYGNFGSHIAKTLAREADLQVIIAGRSHKKAQSLAAQLGTEFAVLDIDHRFAEALATIKPDIVIHTSGPFQKQGYKVAEACIHQGCHYIDLADGTDFVAHIGALDAAAKQKNVAVISGASSVPCLTSAIIDEYTPLFQKITHVDYGISTAQRTNTGLATTQAVLSYAGKPFQTLIDGQMRTIYGWQDMKTHHYPELGKRFLGNCDVPDLALFPKIYSDLTTIRFRAGLEIAFIHWMLWALTWLVRFKLLPSLAPLSATLLKLSRLFDWAGSDRSAFHMVLTGLGPDCRSKTEAFHLIAKSGHGPFIPSIPSILCTKMLARGQITARGAFPCIGVISLQAYLDAMKDLDIRVYR